MAKTDIVGRLIGFGILFVLSAICFTLFGAFVGYLVGLLISIIPYINVAIVSGFSCLGLASVTLEALPVVFGVLGALFGFFIGTVVNTIPTGQPTYDEELMPTKQTPPPRDMTVA